MSDLTRHLGLFIVRVKLNEYKIFSIALAGVFSSNRANFFVLIGGGAGYMLNESFELFLAIMY